MHVCGDGHEPLRNVLYFYKENDIQSTVLLDMTFSSTDVQSTAPGPEVDLPKARPSFAFMLTLEWSVQNNTTTQTEALSHLRQPTSSHRLWNYALCPQHYAILKKIVLSLICYLFSLWISSVHILCSLGCQPFPQM